MRYIFYLLLILNLSLFLWIYQHEQPFDQQQVRRPPIGSLQIVSQEAMQNREPGGVAEMRLQPGAVQPVMVPQVASQTSLQAGKQLALTQRCVAFGPMTTYMQAKLLSTKLSYFMQKSSIRSELVTSVNAYEVIFPLFESDDEAARMLGELKSADVKNAALIDTGKYRKGISVGTYHYRDDAERRLLGVSGFGPIPAIIAHEDRSTLYWVDLDDELEQSLTVEQMQEIGLRFGKVGIQHSACSILQAE